MITISPKQLQAAERIIKERIKTRRFRRQALADLFEQVALIEALDEEDVAYFKWLTGEPAVHLLSNWLRVDGHDVRQLNKDVSEALGL